MKQLNLDWKRLKDLARGLKFIDYVFLILTASGINGVAIVQLFAPQSQLPGYGIILSLVLSVGLLIVILAFATGRQKAPFSFADQSQEEADFFDSWYRQPGTLTIFCTDLDWLDDARYQKVRAVLEHKGDQHKLRLYLKDYTNKFVQSLVKVHQAQLHKVRSDIRSQHRFSVLEDEGNPSIIIRNKDVEPDNTKKIRIEEYYNYPALVNVALDMLDDCEIRPPRSRPVRKHTRAPRH